MLYITDFKLIVNSFPVMMRTKNNCCIQGPLQDMGVLGLVLSDNTDDATHSDLGPAIAIRQDRMYNAVQNGCAEATER